MVQTKIRFLSFEEYLSYEDSEDGLYELFNGELIKLPPESGERMLGLLAFCFLSSQPS